MCDAYDRTTCRCAECRPIREEIDALDRGRSAASETDNRIFDPEVLHPMFTKRRPWRSRR